MYRKYIQGWLKHGDFLLLDMLCLFLSFVLAYWLRLGFSNPFAKAIYARMFFYLEVIDVLVILLFGTMNHVMHRGYYIEFATTLKHVILMAFAFTFYLFLLQEGHYYSRLVLVLTMGIYMVLTYVVRVIWKHMIINIRKDNKSRSLYVVTTAEAAAVVVRSLKEKSYAATEVTGLAIVDQDLTGTEIEGIPVTATAEDAAVYICREYVDEVLIYLPRSFEMPQELLNQISETGVVMHINLTQIGENYGSEQVVEQMGGYTVLTTFMNSMTPLQTIMKRTIDILGGIVGCFITGVIFLFVAPRIKKESPGPVFFSQTRVGRNGRKFKMYKFRSMYLDAEERKAALMAENRIKDGMMFKMEFDPRVIGNEILPDGTHKTGIGDFIRRTSLDEFPQFWNVLKGDMSLVGTRPPTVDEWEKYELHHRARLAIKPGITGMWQTSGRSEILDFEEVVRLDLKYINEWNLGLDIKLILKTIKIMFTGKGAM